MPFVLEYNPTQLCRALLHSDDSHSLPSLTSLPQSPGRVHHDCCIPPLLLPLFLLLGADRGLAILLGCDWQDPDTPSS